jgi:hypothetical protein
LRLGETGSRRKHLDIKDMAYMKSGILTPKQGFKQKVKSAGIALILYQKPVSNRISSLLSRYNIKKIYIPMKRRIIFSDL